jgi:alanine racemase
VATVSAGYADGLPLALTNRGHLIVNGTACPVIGRVSMDYTTVDVSRAGDVRAGDVVVALGGSGKIAVTPDDWAKLKGTHAYDIICSFGNRVERVYVN